MSGFYILWPERRFVRDREIHTWYEDAVANGEVEAGATTPSGRARLLNEAGLITLGLQPCDINNGD